MPSYKKTFLSEDEKERLGRHLTYYLEDYTYKNGITHNEAAKILGISSNKFSQLKSGGEQGRFLSSLDYLKALADLDNMTLNEFLSYLEGENSAPPKRQYGWQEKIYNALENVSITIRKKFADSMAKKGKDSDRAELICRLVTASDKLDSKSLEPLIKMLENL